MCNDNQKLVVVLGMHRSGTSMMSGILTRLGLFSGRKDRLIKEDEYNEKGYFEDRIIVGCNERILSDAINVEFPDIYNSECFLDNKTIDGLGWLYGAWLNETLVQNCTPAESKLIEETIKIYRAELLPNQICLIKDPRMSLTLNKWSEKIKINAAIVMVRSPADVALSLYKRNRITANIAYNIWKLYNLKAMIAVENIPHIIVDYNRFIKNKEKSMRDVLSFIEKEVGLKTDEAVISSILEFVEKKLDHKDGKSELNATNDLLEFYNKLRDGQLKNINDQHKYFYERTKYEWRAAMYVAAKRKGDYMANHIEIKYRSIIDRLDNHIVSGNLIRLIRKIKKDPTFGTYKNT